MSEKAWRPDNWVEILIGIAQHIIPRDIYDKQEVKFARKFFAEGAEAGADAILGALKESGITLSNYNPVNRTVVETAIFLNQCKDGTLVFIPDEK